MAEATPTTSRFLTPKGAFVVDFDLPLSLLKPLIRSFRLLLDYRWFEAHDIAPRYEFGFGLSYTNFTYSDIQIVKNYDSAAKPEVARWEHDGATGSEVGASVAEWYAV